MASTYNPTSESGRHFDMWTWTNPRGLYRLFGIGQDALTVRRFAMFDVTKIEKAIVVKALFGPWVFISYVEREARS